MNIFKIQFKKGSATEKTRVPAFILTKETASKFELDNINK